MADPEPLLEMHYRLRFLLQEVLLPCGDTIIGRGEDCHITIFDSLISRQHARIHVDEAGATLEDLGSRNGCRVNGVLVKGPHVLYDGDRIRVGTQELVFAATRADVEFPRTTGSLCHCTECSLPYPEEMGACPNCGSSVRARDTPDELAAAVSPGSVRAS
jgi:predicted component of type VI protein secretion system